MSEMNDIKRRKFIKTAAAAGVAAGLMTKPSEAKVTPKRDFIKIGMVGLGPYSHAMAYASAINDPGVPPRTNMKVVAVWGREDAYINSFKGSETWKKKRMDELSTYMSMERFKTGLGVEKIVKKPEEMVGLVDAVFITDPENSLNLAKPFLEAGKGVFINRPFAWNIKDAREIIKLAKANNCPLVGGSCIPWMNEFQVATGYTKPEKIQTYYVDGSTANFVSYMAHNIELALKLCSIKTVRCTTIGMTWDKDEDPISEPPVMVHLEHEKKWPDRDPVVGVISSWFGKPYRNWAKVHLDSDVIEQKIFWEEDGKMTDDHLWLPFLRIIEKTFETGVWPEDEDHILNKVSTLLMAHKSGVEKGRPVGLSEIENHSLPRFESEKA